MTQYRCKTLVLIALFFTVSFFLGSCSGITGKQSSVIIIAVENLSGVNFSCNSYSEEEKSGFQTLCDEGVRFTHAFVPSVLSQPNMASILTGQHPIIHGLRDNGLTFLSAKNSTITELITDKEIKTSFVVSSPTLKRYSRLHQGFEIFDDNLNFQASKFYRSAKDVIAIFKEWYTDDVVGAQFFSVLHLSDLMFPLTVTQNDLGESRPVGIESQIEELDESLNELFSFLKVKKLWDNNYIILTGLNGVTDSSRFTETPNTNLFSENTNVVLFIKPPKGREETPHNWKIDELVSIVDLGATIKEIFGVNQIEVSDSKESEKDSLLVGQSLLHFVLLNKNPFSKDRALLIETALPKWAGLGGIRYSLRKSHWLFINDEKPKVYNTLTDRAESVAVLDKELSTFGFIVNARETLDSINVEPWKSIDKGLRESLGIINQFRGSIKYQNEDWSADLLRPIKTGVKNNILRYWLTSILAKNGMWERINEFNATWDDVLIAEFVEVARGKKRTEVKDPCLNYFLKGNVNTNPNLIPSLSPYLRKKCGAEDFILMVDYLASEEPSKEEFRTKFLSRYQYAKNKLTFANLDVILGGSLMALEGVKYPEPLLIELLAMLPQYQKYFSELKEANKAK